MNGPCISHKVAHSPQGVRSFRRCRKRWSFLYRMVFPVALLLSTAGCASVPERQPADDLGLLPNGCDLYLGIDIQANHALVGRFAVALGQDPEGMETALARMTRITAGIENLTADPEYTIVARGEFPGSLVNLGLSVSGELKRHRDRPAPGLARETWWSDEISGVAMWAADESILCISNSDIAVPVARYYSGAASSIPAGAAVDLLGADMAIFMPSLPEGLLEELPIDPGKMQFDGILLKASHEENEYVLSGTLSMTSEKNAATFTKILRFMLVSVMRERGMEALKAFMQESTVESVGKEVNLGGIRFSDDELLDLLLQLMAQTGGFA